MARIQSETIQNSNCRFTSHLPHSLHNHCDRSLCRKRRALLRANHMAERRWLLLSAPGPRFFNRRIETVSHPRLGVDIAGLVWVRLDFFPQLVDEYAQVFGFFSVVRPPDGLQQAGDAPCALPDWLPGDASSSNSFGVSRTGLPFTGPVRFSKSILSRRTRTAANIPPAPNVAARPGCAPSVPRTKRLHDIIVCAGIERLHLVAFSVSHGEHDDGNIARAADFAARLQAGPPRHIHVEQNQIGPLVANCSSASSPLRASTTV